MACVPLHLVQVPPVCATLLPRRAGARLASAAEALGMRVSGLTSCSAPADLAALLASADVVSLVRRPPLRVP